VLTDPAPVLGEPNISVASLRNRSAASSKDSASCARIMRLGTLAGLAANLRKLSRGTIDRSVHRDALSAAALPFEATPLPPRVFVGPAELPLCAALMVGGSISRHPPPTDLSFCRCAPNRQRAIIFLRDDSALVACGSARTPASPLWFLFNVAALQTASELHLWRRNSSACSRSIMAGGTSSHGIGRLSNEVTATFATQRVHSPRYKYKG
jgi:hypothetical protein